MVKSKAIIMKAADNVATVVENIPHDTEVALHANGRKFVVRVSEEISFGHKFAICDISRGDPIIKYGETIGVATDDIRTGQHVHVHNLESARGRGDK